VRTRETAVTDTADISVSVACLGVLLVLVPLVPFNFLHSEKLPAPLDAVIRFFPFVVIVIMVWAGRKDLWGRIKHDDFRLPHVFLLASGLAVVLSAFSSVAVLGALSRATYYTITGEVLCAITLVSVRSRPAITRLLAILMVTATLVSLYGIMEAAFGQTWLSQRIFSPDNYLMTRYGGAPFELTGRAVATIGNPNALGAFLSLCSPFFLLFMGRSHDRLRQICVLAAYLAVVVLLGYTQSRGALLSFLVAALLFLWPRYRRRACGLVAAVLFLFCIAWGWERIESTFFELYDYQNYHRPRSVMIATQIWSDHPWWGVGPGGYRYFCKSLGSQSQTSDNMYLLALAENGTIGFVTRVGFLLSFTILLARHGFESRTGQMQDAQNASNADFLRAFFASTVGFSLNMMTFDALQFPAIRIVFWIVVGLGLALLRLNSPRREGLSYTTQVR
jgi:hypothetical protein